MAWIDLYHRLLVTDLFFLSGRQTEQTAGNVLASLLYWAGCTPSALINGSGGDIYAGIALVDALDAIGGSATCVYGW